MCDSRFRNILAILLQAITKQMHLPIHKDWERRVNEPLKLT